MIQHETARRKLGAALRFHREQRNWNLRRVAHACGVNQLDVEAWEDGRTAPKPEEWSRLIKNMARRLAQLEDIYQAARAEDERERERITGAMTMIKGQKAVTNLGEVISQSTINAIAAIRGTLPTEPPRRDEAPAVAKAAEPSPKESSMSSNERRGSDGRALPPPVPPGSKSREALIAREEFARNVLRTRPAAKFGGDDGVRTLLIQRFGIGIDPATFNRIRAEVLAERSSGKAAAPESTSRSSAAASPVAATAPIEPTPEISDGDVETAVALVLEAIPGLSQFTITVDESGVASVDYKAREVKISERGGSLKVRR